MSSADTRHSSQRRANLQKGFLETSSELLTYQRHQEILILEVIPFLPGSVLCYKKKHDTHFSKEA